MSTHFVTFAVETPDSLVPFRFPEALDRRLQKLLDRQDAGEPLTPQEREEAQGLVNLAE